MTSAQESVNALIRPARNDLLISGGPLRSGYTRWISPGRHGTLQVPWPGWNQAAADPAPPERQKGFNVLDRRNLSVPHGTPTGRRSHSRRQCHRETCHCCSSFRKHWRQIPSGR